MANVFDVAEYILSQRGGMSAMKLQKLVYYSKAWHLVWDEAELFPERIEAWANGPVVRTLYGAHRGNFFVEPGQFAERREADLTDEERDSIDRVLMFYGDKDPQWLSNLTHMESPWQDARVGVADGDRCDKEITAESMVEYYSSL